VAQPALVGRLEAMGGFSLRDLFAAHVAGSLATRVDSSRSIAEKAYDLADALLRERERRAENEAETAMREANEEMPAAEPAWLDFELGLRGTALLDEPMPASERGDEPDARWIEREDRDPESYDPRWARGSVIPPAPQPRPEGPGLARTAPAPEAGGEREKTG
jgi:hypothetical protein